jgi:integrase/recombinase XerD
MPTRSTPRPALHPLIVRWLSWMADVRMCSAKTFERYQSDAGLLTEFTLLHFGTADPREMTTERLAAWLASMVGSLQPSTRRTRHNFLLALYHWMHDSGIIPVNHAALLGRPKVPRRLPRYLTPQQVATMLVEPGPQDLQRTRTWALLHLLCATGIRVGEVRGIKLTDVDLETGLARIIAKGNRERMIWIHPPACAALRRWIEMRASVVAQRGWPELGFLFINFRDGKRFGSMRAWSLVREAGAEVGIERMHPHLLRHSFATNLLTQGVDLRVIQEALGHASITSTMIYTHVATTRLVEVLRASRPLA